MFEFFADAFNYEDRKVDCYGGDGFTVDTCRVSDSTQPYETGTKHREYNGGKWVIVQQYDTIEQARLGHAWWVKKMTTDPLPDELMDVSESGAAMCCFGRNADARRMKRTTGTHRRRVRLPRLSRSVK